jgi:endonuclease/exonuclease/phosphatase (EEP) superfamily protein YafD
MSHGVNIDIASSGQTLGEHVPLPISYTRAPAGEVRHRMRVVAALALAAVALPALFARLADGLPQNLGPRLAALAPAAVLPAVAAEGIAASVAWWLSVLLAIPAAPLVAWLLPPRRRVSHAEATMPSVTLRILTVNVQHGRADAAAVVRSLRRHSVDILAIQELTPEMVGRLKDANLTGELPFAHLDPRQGSRGTGLWARWPLAPLASVQGLAAAAPRARVEPAPGCVLTVTSLHPLAPMKDQTHLWRQELSLVRSTLTATEGTQVVAGDFNATRDHRPFRGLLTAGFLDCADAARSRPWPGFTWPVAWGIVPIMRLDHVLVSRTGVEVHETRTFRIPGADHCGVLAVIELKPDELSRLQSARPGRGVRAGWLWCTHASTASSRVSHAPARCRHRSRRWAARS